MKKKNVKSSLESEHLTLLNAHIKLLQGTKNPKIPKL